MKLSKLKSISELGLYWRTLRYLRPVQVASRLRRKRALMAQRVALPTLDRCAPKSLPVFLERPRSLIDSSHVRVLNQPRQLEFPEGWNSAAADRLWLYHLHYLDGLLNDGTASELKDFFARRWVLDNPVGVGTGWEPYPLSRRIVSWIKWSLTSANISEEVINSLTQQASYLAGRLEYHLLGNHLFANAKALLFAGLYLSGRQPAEWRRTGFRILSEEIDEQFLSDGGHFELSPTYHAQMTEDLLDVIQLCRVYEQSYSKSWDDIARRALMWLVVMTRPDGVPPLFNDAAYDVAPRLSDLLGYAQRLGLIIDREVRSGLTGLETSGYFRYQGTEYCVFVDAGQIGPDYIPGHAHCDMLNFELFARGRPMIVDTGVSTYERGDRRQLERSTRSHNTVQIGDREQSEIWAAFRVGRRAKIRGRVRGSQWLEASHDGFMPAGAIHTRRFEFQTSSVAIIDSVETKRPLQEPVVARFHFRPGIVPRSTGGSSVTMESLKMTFDGARTMSLRKYEYAPTFNVRQLAFVLEVEFRERLLTRISL